MSNVRRSADESLGTPRKAKALARDGAPRTRSPPSVPRDVTLSVSPSPARSKKKFVLPISAPAEDPMSPIRQSDATAARLAYEAAAKRRNDLDALLETATDRLA